MRSLCTGFGIILAAVVLFATAQASAAAGDAAKGGKMYMASCTSAACHVAKPSYMIGRPVEELVSKMQKYKDMTDAVDAAAAMKLAVMPLSTQDMTDLAAYLNGLK